MTRISLYAAPPFNYLGTTLFLSYILLALTLTIHICISLRSQYNSIPSAKAPLEIKNVRRRHIKIYAFLASLSFALLSTNMVGFLLTSLSTWARARSLLGERVGVWSLGRWMLESRLFGDFARELVGRKASAVWTHAVVLGTWGWNVWMGGKAHQHALPTRTMIPFIALSQILPITFTACLFTIQLHLSAMGLSPTTPSSPSAAKSQSKPTTTPSEPPSKNIPLLLPTLALNALLISIPTLSSTLFIPALLLTRAILLLPHTSCLRARDNDVLQSIAVSLGCVVASVAMGRGDVGYADIVRGVSKGGYAVKALGWDGVVGAVVWLVRGWGGGL